MKHSYTKNEFLNAVKKSNTKRQVLILLGLSPRGGNYKTFDNLVLEWNVDISHFKTYSKGQCWNKGIKTGHKRPIEDYLNNLVKITSYRLKIRLLEDSIFDHICSNCSMEKWLEEKIPLELDHIDGNSKNNNLKNLRLLCPNCHSLTPTYRGKNR